MQLSDILEDTDPVLEALDEMLFQKHLRKLSRLPDWKKREAEETIKKQDFTFYDLMEIWNEN